MDLVQSAVLYAVMTLVSTYLVAFAYKNVKFVLKHKYVLEGSEVLLHDKPHISCPSLHTGRWDVKTMLLIVL